MPERRGKNANFHDRLVASETNRTYWYPLPGKYLAAIRKADQIVAAGGTIKTNWCGPALDAAGWKREKMRALMARITAKGGNRYSRFNSPHLSSDCIDSDIVRDAQRLLNYRNGIVIRGSGWCTSIFRKRFGYIPISGSPDDFF